MNSRHIHICEKFRAPSILNEIHIPRAFRYSLSYNRCEHTYVKKNLWANDFEFNMSTYTSIHTSNNHQECKMYLFPRAWVSHGIFSMVGVLWVFLLEFHGLFGQPLTKWHRNAGKQVNNWKQGKETSWTKMIDNRTWCPRKGGAKANHSVTVNLLHIVNLRGKPFYLQLELFCLQLSFFAYSPLRPLLDALSHCK